MVTHLKSSVFEKYTSIAGEILVDQPDKRPTRKVMGGAVAGGATGAMATLLIVIWNMAGIDEPLSVEAAGAIVAAFAVVGDFVGGYFTRERI